MELPAHAIRQLLETWPVARLATLDAEGRPAPVPIVFVVRGSVLWSPVDGKPKRSARVARLRHLERDPRVSVLLDDYTPDWRRLWWLRLDGEGSAVRADAPERDAELGPVVEGLRAKYPQYGEVALFRGEPTLLRIEIARMRSWCATSEVVAGLQPSRAL